jgi:hypothetical protein
VFLNPTLRLTVTAGRACKTLGYWAEPSNQIPAIGEKCQKSERAAIQRMADLGLFSCWSASHPDLPLEQTLRWASDKAAHKATPFHCDGIFVPVRWHDRTICEVFTSTCYRTSDHNPVVAWIDE